MNSQLDVELGNVRTLKWFPFIGKDYLTIPDDKKMLIVGESHYHDNSQQSIDDHDSVDFTRMIIRELAIKRCYGKTRIFQNIYKAMFDNGEFSAELFWGLTSFYNFIQRPMNTNKDRPNYDEYFNSWFTFFDTIAILKPSICLFIGVEASNSLIPAINESDLELVNFSCDEKICRTYPRRATIKTKSDQLIELFFIQHTSQYFSWSKWNVYIKHKLCKQIEWYDQNMKD